MSEAGTGFRAAVAIVIAAGLVTAYLREAPPIDQANVCRVFEQRPAWHDHARAAEARWGIPASTLMAFVQLESAYGRDARPAREPLLGFIPRGYRSSAFGYGQILDATWAEYRDARGGLGRSRESMRDVLDFIGWYNRRTVERLGIAPRNAEHLYLAYHQGRAGYASGRWRERPGVRRYARRVAERAARYEVQLERCAERFRCDGWWQLGPLCRTADAGAGRDGRDVSS